MGKPPPGKKLKPTPPITSTTVLAPAPSEPKAEQPISNDVRIARAKFAKEAAARREDRRIARIDRPVISEPDFGSSGIPVLNLRGLQQLSLNELTEEQTLALIDGAIFIPVRYDDWGDGWLQIEADGAGRVSTSFPQLLPLDHPALPKSESDWTPALAIGVDHDAIDGQFAQVDARVTSPAIIDATLGFVVDEASAQDFLELEDLQELTIGKFENKFYGGELHLHADDLSFKLDGVFPGTGKFDVDAAKGVLQASASVEAEGIDSASVTIQRDELGQLTAKGDVHGNLTTPEGHHFDGQLKAEFSRGVFSITGSGSYKWSSGEGTLEVQIADYDTAWQSVRDWLGDQAPQTPLNSDAPLGLVVVGRGSIRFDENEWLSGTAEVVLDPDGYVTAIGSLTPSKEIGLFGKKQIGPKNLVPPWEDSEFFPETPIGPVYVRASISLTAQASVGPGTLQNIVIDGNFTTRPGVAAEFSIAADVVVPGSAEIDLNIEGTGYTLVGSIDVNLWGKAKLDAEASATPKIGRERHPKDPASAVYFVEGYMRASGTLILALGGSVLVDPLYLHEATFGAVPRKTLFSIDGKVWTLGSAAVSFNGRYNLASKDKADAVMPQMTYFLPTDFDVDDLVDRVSHGNAPSGSAYADEKDKWIDGVTPGEEEPHVKPHKPGGGGTTIAEEVPTVAQPELAAYTSAPRTGPQSAPAPLKLNILMNRKPHELMLVREEPAHIEMASGTPEPLRAKLATTEEAIEEEAEHAALGSGHIVDNRTAEDLQEEEKDLDKLLDDTIAVEERARDVPDPTNPPEHVAGFEQLAGEIEAYGRERGRDDFLDAPKPGAPPPKIALTDRPKELDGTDTPAFDQVWRTNRRKGVEYLADGKAKYNNKDDLAKYLDGRAARRLGRDVEKPTLIKYNEWLKDHGKPEYKGGKNALEIQVMNPEGEWEAWEPDFIDDEVVGDIKNVAYQSFTPQMKADVAIAKGINARWKTTKKPVKTKRFDLIVRSKQHKRGKTTVSAPLEEAVNDTGGTVIDLITDPET